MCFSNEKKIWKAGKIKVDGGGAYEHKILPYYNHYPIHGRTNTIGHIRKVNGVWTDSSHEIGAEFETYYSTLFTSTSPSFLEEWESLYSPCISESENLLLNAIPTDKEMRKTIFQMSSGKSPGPDGMNPNFSKTFVSIVGEDVITSVQHFFITEQMNRGVNHTFITLILKTDQAPKVEHYPLLHCVIWYSRLSRRFLQQELDLYLRISLLRNRLRSHLIGKSPTIPSLITRSCITLQIREDGSNGNQSGYGQSL